MGIPARTSHLHTDWDGNGIPPARYSIFRESKPTLVQCRREIYLLLLELRGELLYG